MLPKSREETLELLAKFAERKLAMEEEDKGRESRVDQAAKYIKWLWTFIIITGACASTAGVALYDISQQKLELAKVNIKLERFRDVDDEYKNKFQFVENRIDSNREERRSQLAAMEREIEDLMSRKKEHDIMWSMKENGRSNKEEYMRLNHIPAPNIPEN